jgi:hypothetical protein
MDLTRWIPHGWGGKERPRCRRVIGRIRRSSGSGSFELVWKGRTPEATRNWVKQAALDAGQRLDGLTTEEREELRRLRRENRQHPSRRAQPSSTAGGTTPNLSRRPGSVYILDSFLRSEFSPVRQTTAYDVLVKR